MNTLVGVYHIGAQGASRWAFTVDGKALDLDKSLKVWNHSPTGFNIGYEGSGPAQLALAILMEFTDKVTAVELHQQFKREFLSKPVTRDPSNFPDDGEAVTLEIDVPAWITKKVAERIQEEDDFPF